MSQPKVKSAKDAQAIVMQKLREGYGDRLEVSFSKTMRETNLADSRELWMVEGDAKIRKWLFWGKMWHFTYFIDADSGRISIMRGRPG